MPFPIKLHLDCSEVLIEPTHWNGAINGAEKPHGQLIRVVANAHHLDAGVGSFTAQRCPEHNPSLAHVGRGCNPVEVHQCFPLLSRGSAPKRGMG